MTRLVVAAAILAAVATVHSERVVVWYFDPQDVPVGVMGPLPPVSSTVPDPDADGLPGRTLATDDYQEFLSPSGGLHIEGAPQVDVWLAAPEFSPQAGGSLSIGLLECRADGCHAIAETVIEATRWSPDQDWVAYEIQMPEVDVQLDADSQVCVRFDPIGAAVMLAYGSTRTPGSLMLPIAPGGSPESPEEPGVSSTTSIVPNTTTSLPTTTSLADDRSDLIRPEQADRIRPIRRSPSERLAPVASAVVVVLLAAFGLGVAAFRSRD